MEGLLRRCTGRRVILPSVTANPLKMAPIAEFFADCATGNLPAVSFVDPEIGALNEVGSRLAGIVPIANGADNSVDLARHRRVIARGSAQHVGTATHRLVLHPHHPLVSGTYSLVIRHAGRTLVRRRVHIGR